MRGDANARGGRGIWVISNLAGYWVRVSYSVSKILKIKIRIFSEIGDRASRIEPFRCLDRCTFATCRCVICDLGTNTHTHTHTCPFAQSSHSSQ